MKKIIIITASFFVFLSAFAPQCFGQEYIKLERSKKFIFANESKVAETKIDVTEEYNFLQIQIQSVFQAGEALVEILDPKGEVRGKYSIITDSDIKKGANTSVSSMVNAEMERAYRDPAKGDWKVRITPKNAAGETFIRTLLIFHPKADVLEIDKIEKGSGSKKN